MSQKIIKIPLDKTNVVDRLDQLSLKGNELIAQIKKWDCLIAGSFPLQCLLNEHYKYSDVDIYIKYKESEYDDFLHPVENWIRNNYRGYTYSCHYMIYGIMKSNRYITNEKTIINIIIVKTTLSLKQYVYDNFDLSFCMTMIDGDNLSYSELSKKKIGHVVNLKRKQRSSVCLPKINGDKDYRNRLRKMLFGDEEIDTDMLSVYDTLPDNDILKKRISKYTDRGFKIITESVNQWV